MVFVAYKTNSTNTPFSFLLFTSYSTYCISTCAMAGTENSEETTVFPDSVVYSYLTTWEISEYIFNKIADVVIIFIAFVLLMCSLVGFSIYLLYMRKDEANKDRLLNVLYANLSICSISFCWVMFVQFLLLDTIYDTESVWWCLLVRWRLFIGLFATLLFLQISVVTSINHYNPGLYLHLSLHWRRIPVLCLQFIIVGLTLGLIELSTGFVEVCISVKTKDRYNLIIFSLLTFNLILQLGVVVDTYWGWRNLKKYAAIRFKKPSSTDPENIMELAHSGEARNDGQHSVGQAGPIGTQLISTDKVNME